MLRNTFIFLFFLLINAKSFADDWLYLGSSKDKQFDYFIKSQSVKKSDENRSAWILFNYSTSSKGIRSSVALNEYDCSKKQVRTNYLMQYDGEMATGNILMSSSPPKDRDYWRQPEQQSVAKAILDSVCTYESRFPEFKS